MNLLVTGAFKATEEQLNKLRSLGFAIFFQNDEMGEPECDFSSVDAVVCNGLFKYHSIDEFINLKVIQLTSAGLDKVPLDKINGRGIKLFNARGVYSIPMAEFCVAGTLNLYKHFGTFYENKTSHEWKKDRHLRELNGETVLIVGCGSVGTECAKRFKAFGTKVIAADILKPQSDIYDGFYSMNEIKKAVSISDVVVLTMPLTDETRGMFDSEILSEFKENAILVNISRGAVVAENDLIDFLSRGKLGGAVLDVFLTEPLSKDSPLWEMENVVITPHNSFVSERNNDRLFSLAYDNLKKYGENNGK